MILSGSKSQITTSLAFIWIGLLFVLHINLQQRVQTGGANVNNAIDRIQVVYYSNVGSSKEIRTCRSREASYRRIQES